MVTLNNLRNNNFTTFEGEGGGLCPGATTRVPMSAEIHTLSRNYVSDVLLIVLSHLCSPLL